MDLQNATHLNTDALHRLFLDAVAGWPHDELRVLVRHSRGAEFSGSCYYRPPRIHINLGRHNRYPYLIRTHVARPRSNRRMWWRELFGVEAADATQLAFFIFMHEFYHWLVRKARRNSRQKEGRCDRFAVRAMVERWGMPVLDTKGRPVPRREWDFQDLDAFVAAARPRNWLTRPLVRRPLQESALPSGAQLTLFAL